MGEDKVVYRTTDPEIIASYDKAVEEYRDWRRAIRTLAHEVHPEANPMVWTLWGDHCFDGVSLVDPVPEGWRIKKVKNGPNFIVPRKSTKVGKDWAERIGELSKAPNVRAALPGMPSQVLDGVAVCAPGVEHHGSVLYVIWSCDPDQADTGWSSTAAKVDREIWERVKLSEYYAAHEAREEEAS